MTPDATPVRFTGHRSAQPRAVVDPRPAAPSREYETSKSAPVNSAAKSVVPRPVPGVMTPDTVTKYYQSSVQDGPCGPSEVIALITTDRVDRDREVVVPSGVRLANYQANPVVMYGHAKGKPIEGDAGLPVGKNLWIKPSRDGRGLVAKHSFDLDHAFSKGVCGKAKGGFLNTYSITVLPIRQARPTAADLAAHPHWRGADNVIWESELVEYSIVAMPANVDAVTIAKERKGNAVDKPETREEFIAGHPDVGRLIDGLTDLGAFIELAAGAAAPVSKGALLGDLRKPALSAVIERYTGRLNSYLWGLAFDDAGPPEGLAAKVKAGFDEARDAAVLVFESLEPLRSAPDLMAAMGGPVDVLSRSLSIKAKALFGDPAAEWAELVSKARTGEEAADEVETEDDSADAEMPVKRGDHVRAAKGEHKGMVGKVKSVHTSGMVPDVEENVKCSKADPGARVECFKAFNGGHVETGEHVGVKCNHLERVDEMKPPKKKKAAPSPEAPKGWSDADRAAVKAARLASPDFLRRLESRIAERFEVTILGKV